ncbi:NAD-P-binding protein [Dentipellis sp. KUC8613]|nr:NAD-P-binding protein [Dentipellis sp. KUC8613]
MGFLFSRQTYDPNRDIPDLNGKVVIVTGANAGIGAKTVEQLARHGAKVYLACRSEEKAAAAIADIERTSPALKGQERLVWLPLDLSSVHSAKKAAEEFLSKEDRLDILIAIWRAYDHGVSPVNNAARLIEDYVIGKEGVELNVAVNQFGHFVFTQTLLPLLKETAKRQDADVRIIAVSSSAYLHPGTTKFGSLEDLNDPQAPPGKENTMQNKMLRYGTSKLMNVLFAAEIQRRLDAENASITVISLHPGAVSTESANAADLPWYVKIYIATLAMTPLQGAMTSLFAATSSQVAAEREKYKGKYLEPYGKIAGPATAASKDPLIAKTLWDTTERITAELLKKSSA